MGAYKADVHDEETIVRFSKADMQVARWRHKNELDDSHLGFIGEYALSLAMNANAAADDIVERAFIDTFGYSLRSLMQILKELPSVWNRTTLRNSVYIRRQLDRKHLSPGWWEALRSLVLPESGGDDGKWTLEADEDDRREMLAVADLMESLRAPG